MLEFYFQCSRENDTNDNDNDYDNGNDNHIPDFNQVPCEHKTNTLTIEKVKTEHVHLIFFRFSELFII